MPNTLNPVAAQAPAAGLAAVATLAAPTNGTRWKIDGIAYSYSAAPPAGANLQLAWMDGGVAYTETIYIVAAGPGYHHFPQVREFPTNQGVTITLSAPGGAILATVYPHAWTAH